MIKNINYNKYNEIKNTIIPKLKKSTALYGNPMERIVYSLEHTLNNNPIENIQKNKHQTKILVLSEGEDMYIPSRIAFYLEEHGYNVKFKTTTRSPIAVDGKTIQECNSGDIKVTIEGDVNKIDCGGSVEVHGNSGSIDCGGSCEVNGDVKGDIDAGGSVTCGNVSGDIDAGGSVRCRR